VGLYCGFEEHNIKGGLYNMDMIDPETAGFMLERQNFQVFAPQHWEMNLSEIGYFLVQWGWVLNIKPPPYIVDDESWQLMNKINKRKSEEDLELTPLATQKEMPEKLKNMLEQLINRK